MEGKWHGVRAVARGVAMAWTVVLLVVAGALLAVRLRGDRLDLVLSPSMTPAVPSGSLVVVTGGPVELGSVIVFEQPGSGRLVTHRVVGVSAGDDGLQYRTKGDANPLPDRTPVPASEVEGRVVAHVPGLGQWLHAWRRPVGLTLLVVPPLAAAAFGAVAGRARRPDITPTTT